MSERLSTCYDAHEDLAAETHRRLLALQGARFGAWRLR